MAFIKIAVLLAVSAFVLSAAEDLKAEATDYGYPRLGYGHQKASPYGLLKTEYGHGQSSPDYERYGKPGYGQSAPYEHGPKPKGGSPYGHRPTYRSDYQGPKSYPSYGPNYEKKYESYSSY